MYTHGPKNTSTAPQISLTIIPTVETTSSSLDGASEVTYSDAVWAKRGAARATVILSLLPLGQT